MYIYNNICIYNNIHILFISNIIYQIQIIKNYFQKRYPGKINVKELKFMKKKKIIVLSD